jgi:tetratricopeptide (TPR) repeat protein
MLDCPDDRALSAYLEGCLDRDGEFALEEHLDKCELCLAVVANAGRQQAREDSDLQVGDFVGRYQILSRIGAGAMGVVFAAYDPQLDRKIALKVLHGTGDPSARKRLILEAKAIAKVEHPNVVAIHDAGSEGERVFIAMAFVDGLTLRQWLSSEQRSWQKIRDVFCQAALGLHAAHRADLVHRDVKPDNLLVDQEGRVHVVDFGLARSHGVLGSEPPAAAGQKMGVTQTGLVAGTPAYMAPEVLSGSPASVASDQFSLCVSLYEALHGQRPFLGNSPVELLGAMTSPPRAGELRGPSWLRDPLLRGLRPEPGERHPSLLDLANALQRDRRRGRRNFAVGLAAALLALAALTYYFAAHREETSGRPLICSTGEAGLRRHWDAEAQEELRAALEPLAGQKGAERAVERINHYASAWLHEYRDSCTLTYGLGIQSEHLFDLRGACLSERLSSLEQLLSVLRDKPAAEQQILDAIRTLPDIRECGDVQALESAGALPGPSDESAHRRLDGVWRRATVLRGLGRNAEAIALLEAETTAISELDYPPLSAEAYRIHSQLYSDDDKLDRAEDLLWKALEFAYRSRDDARIAAHWSTLASIAAEAGRGHDEVEERQRIAEFSLKRAGDPPAERAIYLFNKRHYLVRRGKAKEALAVARQAKVAAEAGYGPESPVTHSSRVYLASSLASNGKHQEAEEILAPTVDEVEQSLGRLHPRTLNAQATLRKSPRCDARGKS